MKVSPEKTSVKQLILKLQNRKELMEWAYNQYLKYKIINRILNIVLIVIFTMLIILCITKKEHLDEIPLSLNELKGILSFRLSEFLKEYEVEDIVSFGAFIILESNTEINDFKSMMLTEPITADSIEWVETVKTDTKTYQMLSTL